MTPELILLAAIVFAAFTTEATAALAWARAWALGRGVIEDAAITAEFESHYDEQQRRDIVAAATTMDFSNRFMNTISGDVLVPPTHDSKRSAIKQRGLRWSKK